MSDHPRPTRLSRLLARCYPRELREQYADDIARFIDDARRDSRARFRPLGMAYALSVAGLAQFAASDELDLTGGTPMRGAHKPPPGNVLQRLIATFRTQY